MTENNSAVNIARHIIEKWSSENIKVDKFMLQKLLFLGQSMSLYFFDKKLFREEIRAWKYGPVISTVYTIFVNDKYFLFDTSSTLPIDDISELVIDELFHFFGDDDGLTLMEKTHDENGAWKKYYIQNKKNVIPEQNIKTEMRLYEDIVKYFEEIGKIDESLVYNDMEDILKGVSDEMNAFIDRYENSTSIDTAAKSISEDTLHVAS